MHKVAKAILVAGCILAALVTVGMLCVNLYVQSSGVQIRIAKAMGEAAHLEIKLTGANFTPWSGLRLTGLEAPQPDPSHPGDFFQAPEIHARIALLPLLRRRCVVKELAVVDSAVTWYQDENGSWQLPAAQAPQPAEAPVIVSASPPSPTVPAAPPNVAPSVSAPPFRLAVDHFRLKRGALEFLDHGGRSVAAFSGVYVDCPNPRADFVTGKARVSEASIRDFLKLRDLSATFSFDKGNLLLPAWDAHLAQGRIAGSFQMRAAVAESPFSAEARFDNVEVARVIPPRFQSMVSAQGFLDGFLSVSGNAKRQESILGKGRVTLRSGRVRYPLFQTLGDLLRIDELSELDLDRAELDYHLADGKLIVDELLLGSRNLQVSAKGKVRFDGQLELVARLTLDQKVFDRLPSFVAENFATSAGAGSHYRDINVTGSVASPKTDLVERDAGKKIKREIGDLLRNVFGARRKEDKRPPVVHAPALPTFIEPIPASSASRSPFPPGAGSGSE